MDAELWLNLLGFCHSLSLVMSSVSSVIFRYSFTHSSLRMSPTASSPYHLLWHRLSFIFSYYLYIRTCHTVSALHIIFRSLHSIMSLTSSPSSLLITCPYHLSLASLTFSVMFTTSHLLILSFHNVSDQLSFISSYYVSIASRSRFPNLLCNVYHPTSFDPFIP